MGKIKSVFKAIGSVFDAGKKPDAALSEPPPPVPTRDDPKVLEARQREVAAAKLRKGRAAAIKTSSQGVTDQLSSSSVSRPAARSATLLGGT